MSIKSFFQSLFAPKKQRPQQDKAAPRVDGRVRHPWLIDQTKNAKRVGEHIIRPPQDMPLSRAQILVNSRFWKLVGKGNFSTHQRRKGNRTYIQVIVRAVSQ